MNRLYVGNLQWSVSENDLRTFFSVVGNVVSAVVILDRNTGKSRGFGFVEMSSREEAERAIEQLNSQFMEGRKIFVNWANPEGQSKSNKPKNNDVLIEFLNTSEVNQSVEFDIDDKLFNISRLS